MRTNGRARVSTQSPAAFGICDRCGQRWNRIDLSWQYEWQGMQLQNQRLLVCPTCLDEPNPQLRTYIPPPDPVPVRDPRLDLSVMGTETTIATAANASTALVGADAARASVDFVAPIGGLLWVNPTGGTAAPSGAGCQIVPAGTPFVVRGTAAQSAMTYWCATAGLAFAVEAG